VEVLVDSQWTPQEPQQEAQLYTYRLPPDIEVHPGDILTVPFGAQQMGAIAIRLLDSPPSNLDPAIKIKEVEDVQSAAFFQPSYWQLLERVAQYYCTPLMWVIRGALPPGLLRSSQRRIRLKKAAIPDKGADTFVSPCAHFEYKLPTDGDYSWQYIQRQNPRCNTGELRQLLKRG
jgi:primosomal protein N' (replication factor Y)